MIIVMRNREVKYSAIKSLKVQKFQKYYSEKGFWDKVKAVAKKASIKAVFTALTLYYALDFMPIEKKAIVIGALGYFILPTDFIPDFVVFLGFTDDTTVLFLVYKTFTDIINEEVKKQAKSKLSEWLGEIDERKL